MPLRLPPAPAREALLGPFALDGAWRLDSPHARFGGYSGLVRQGGGVLLAISDRGYRLDFTPPGRAGPPPALHSILPGSEWELWSRDSEAATRDPASGRIWIAWEGINTITRHAAGFAAWRQVRPPAMRDWSENMGPEAMLRLADGRFVVLREAFAPWFGNHRNTGLLFAADPVAAPDAARFMFEGPVGFRPVDMAQLPDGRVLVLLRRLVWPFPARFEGRIALADPAAIRAGGVWRARALARLEPPLPTDNYEALAVEPRGDGMMTVWVLSDDNGASLQRTLLLRLRLDPARLPD